MTTLTLPSQSLSATATISDIPGDKSISHRAVILGALSESEVTFTNFLCALDCLHTADIFRQMGVPIEVDKTTLTLRVKGVGLQGLKAPSGTLDCGNSGTGIRLITGVLAAQSFRTEISGDDSIKKRPMKRIIAPLSQMGAQISGQSREGKTDLYPPLVIEGTPALTPIRYTLPVASAQIKSALLLASLYCKERSEIIEPERCRDHSERMLKGFGADIHFSEKVVFCSGKNPLVAPHPTLHIPSDISSAAFFIVLACILPNTSLTFDGIGLNPTRISVLTHLQRMGANIHIDEVHGTDFEPYGNIHVNSSSLHNTPLLQEEIPFLIDEIPILAVAALFAKGPFEVRGAKELRAKESDRIASIRSLCEAAGAQVEEFEDGFVLTPPQHLTEFEIDSHGDHRIAMSAAIAALGGQVKATIHDCDCIQTSFPNFVEILSKLGAAAML